MNPLNCLAIWTPKGRNRMYAGLQFQRLPLACGTQRGVCRVRHAHVRVCSSCLPPSACSAGCSLQHTSHACCHLAVYPVHVCFVKVLNACISPPLCSGPVLFTEPKPIGIKSPIRAEAGKPDSISMVTATTHLHFLQHG